MKTDWKKRLICWAIPLAVGALGALLSGGMSNYRAINQPPLSPPGWVFPIVWTALYLLMGEASYRVLTSGKEESQVKRALTVYGIQLALNLLWPIVFFRYQMYLGAFIVILLLWAAIFLTMRLFTQADETAGEMIVPYFLWVTFAAYLNLGVYLLN